MFRGGDGGPLVVLQSTAAAIWQGALDFDKSLMNGGNVETDYAIICDIQTKEGIGIGTRYCREMLVLWDSEFGAIRVPPQLLYFRPEVVVLTMCFPDEELIRLTEDISASIGGKDLQRSLLFDVQDTSLRLQVGADSPDPSYLYNCLDIPITSGMKRCDVCLVQNGDFRCEVLIIDTHQEQPA